MKTRCLIVDDEPLAVEAMKLLIQKIDDLRIIATCHDAIKAFQVLKEHPVDLMFLDIQMPEITGLDFLKTLKNPPGVILTTAYRDFALEAFNLDVVDYLLKPIGFERFMQAINKYYDSQLNGPTIQTVSPNYAHNQTHFFVRSDKKHKKVEFRDVLYIESIKDYVRIVCKNQTVISKLAIGDLEHQLPENQFLRIHRSYIICIPNILAFSTSSIELPGKEIPIGRNYKQIVNSILHAGNR